MTKANQNKQKNQNIIEGFFGGKFLPMHKGHLYCIDTAARQCDHVVVIMFINGDDELRVRAVDNDSTLQIDYRIEQGNKMLKYLTSHSMIKKFDIRNLKLNPTPK